MSKKPNHICPVCGVAYYACRSCGDRGTWRSVCDTMRHYQVYMALLGYVRGQIKIADAAEQLEHIGINVDNIAEYTSENQRIMQEILGYGERKDANMRNKKKKKSVKIVT